MTADRRAARLPPPDRPRRAGRARGERSRGAVRSGLRRSATSSRRSRASISLADVAPLLGNCQGALSALLGRARTLARMSEHDHDHDGALSRRGALAKLGGLAAVALGGAALGDAGAPRRGGGRRRRHRSRCRRLGARQLRARSRADRGAVLRRGRGRSPERDRREARGAAHPPADRGERRELQADQGRRGRDLALRRGRRVLGCAGRQRGGSCEASSARTRRVSRSFARSTRAGTRGGPCTSTRRCTWAGTSCTRGSCTSPTR